MDQNIDIIIANDDTDTEIQVYEKNCNGIYGFGLFITKRNILDLEPCYVSNICKSYLNFENVSFGVIFD